MSKTEKLLNIIIHACERIKKIYIDILTEIFSLVYMKCNQFHGSDSISLPRISVQLF